jgi:hypothetical protein
MTTLRNADKCRFKIWFEILIVRYQLCGDHPQRAVSLVKHLACKHAALHEVCGGDVAGDVVGAAGVVKDGMQRG